MFSSCSITSESKFNLILDKFKCRHKKSHCTGTSGKRNDTVKIDYDSQSAGLEAGISDVVCQDFGSSRTAAETQTITEQENEGISEREFRALRMNLSTFRGELQGKDTDGWNCN